MKITKVEPLMVDRFCFARIETDSGLVGVGESGTWGQLEASATAIQKYAEYLVAKDPRTIEHHWNVMLRANHFTGGAINGAVSAIDIALWDIKGKTLGQPIHRLLGGPHRTAIRAYASTLMPETPEETGDVVAGLVARGFTAVKLGWGPFGRDADLDVALVRAARQAAGDDVELMFDIGLGWPDADHAIRQVRRFEEYRPYWVEEPLWPDDVPGYRKLADAVETRIACGEEDATRWGFAQLMERTAVDVIQPDVTRAGGISECVRIAQLAALRGVAMVPHSWSTGIIKAASLHVIGAMPNATFLEYCVQETALNQLLTVERFPVVDGMVALPEGPGLGVEIDEDVVRKYAT